jgi:NADH-quinone oxidoreductase subunit A
MNALFFLEYKSIFIYLIVSLGLALVFVMVSYLFASQIGGIEKLSTYECGFEPFEDARNTFDIKFYIIAMLFIIFDIEVAYLFPWAVSFFHIGPFGFWISIDFFIELVVGYIYVFKKGAFIF